MRGGKALAFWVMVGAAIWAAIILLVLDVADYFDATTPRSAPEPTGSPTPIAMTAASSSPSALAESAAASAPEQSRAPLIRLPTAAPVPTPRPTSKPRGIVGTASWYDGPTGQAAAGPRLRAFLGVHWRGQRVTVCAMRCIRVTLSDWCACGRRIIDLDDRAFRQLAPLSKGLVTVKVSR